MHETDADAATPFDHKLRKQAESVGRGLQASVLALIGELESSGLRDQKSMQAALHLSQSAVSRLGSSVRKGDPLATMCSIPGPEALRQMLKGASSSGASAACLRRVEGAVAEFEHFVAAAFGDRTTLDAVLSDWVRESRSTFELRHKAAAFKAMSALRGVQAELVFSTGILHPSASHPGRHDCIGLDGVIGCRRTRPSGVLHLFGYSLVPDATRLDITGLDRAPASGLPELMLPGFSSVEAADVKSAFVGGVMQTTVDRLPLGRSSPQGADLICGQWMRGLHRASRVDVHDGAPTAGIAGQAEPPTACYVVDALLHDDVWPDVQPELRLYDTVVRGVAHPDDASRRSDRLDMMESLTYLGRGEHAFRMPEYPRYTELVLHACRAAGWDPSALRAFRCAVRYPIHGSQIGLSFELPTPASSA